MTTHTETHTYASGRVWVNNSYVGKLSIVVTNDQN